MAWGDNLSESVAEKLEVAGKWATAGGLAAAVVGALAGMPPLVLAGAVTAFAGAFVPPVYGMLEIESRAAREEDAASAWPCEKSICSPARQAADDEAVTKFVDMLAAQKERPARHRLH